MTKQAINKFPNQAFVRWYNALDTEGQAQINDAWARSETECDWQPGSQSSSREYPRRAYVVKCARKEMGFGDNDPASAQRERQKSKE